MRHTSRLLTAALFALSVVSLPAFSDDGLEPYGTAVDHSQLKYDHLKIVMDAPGAVSEDTEFQAMVAERLMEMPHAKLIMVIQGPAVKLFSKAAYVDHQDIVQRIAALRDRGVQIEFCGNSLKAAHLVPSDMIGIGTVVPGAYPAIADAERHGYVLIKPMRVLPSP